MSTVADTLREAKALIDTPEKWRDGERSRPYADCACMAVWAAGAADGGKRERAVLRALLAATGVRPYSDAKSIASFRHPLYAWNDGHDRTHAEVMAAFDRAIATAEATS